MDSSLSEQVFSRSTLSEILDDLCVRFIVHLPEEELMSVERICFQIEEAHWFYEDFIRETNPGLPNVNLRSFIHQIFNHIPQMLISHIPLWKTENAFTDFMIYKTRVPVRGAIMLNTAMNQCVLVKGWKSGASWAFPRGKIDQDEDDRDCAIREVLEETGFDLTDIVRPDDFVEMNIRDQNVRLYIAAGIPEDAKFAPRTRKEISKIEWHKLSDLPGFSSKKGQKEQHHIRSGKFYMVAPFLRDLRKWISTMGKKWLTEQQKAANSQQNLSSAAVNMAAIEDETEVEDDSFLPAVKMQNSADGLRSLLGIKKAAEVLQHGQMSRADQEEASRRLKAMLNGTMQVGSSPKQLRVTNEGGSGVSLLTHTGMIGIDGSSATNRNAAANGNGNPNARALLSILQNGSGNDQTQPPPSFPMEPATDHSYPQMQGPPTSMPPPYMQNLLLSPQGFPHSNQAVPPPPQMQYQSAPAMAAPPMMQPFLHQFPNGWQQHLGGPITPASPTAPPQYRGPSPPSHARYGMPALPPHHPLPVNQPSHFSQQPRGPIPHLNQNIPPITRPHQPPTLGPQDQYRTSFQQHVPPTPVEAFLPPPVPTKPPDPGQAGALLSILRGTASPAPAPPQPQPQAENSPPVPTTGESPIALQQAPPPRGPKSQTHQRMDDSGPPTTNATPTKHRASSRLNSHNFTPPARPTATQPPRTSTPSTLRTSTPTIIDHYGTPKPAAALPTTKFDRRESVSGDQAKTLLAMFRTQTPNSPPQEVAVSSPVARLRTPAAATAPAKKSPAGKDRDALMAYLRGVADLGL